MKYPGINRQDSHCLAIVVHVALDFTFDKHALFWDTIRFDSVLRRLNAKGNLWNRNIFRVCALAGLGNMVFNKHKFEATGPVNVVTFYTRMFHHAHKSNSG